MTMDPKYNKLKLKSKKLAHFHKTSTFFMQLNSSIKKLFRIKLKACVLKLSYIPDIMTVSVLVTQY